MRAHFSCFFHLSRLRAVQLHQQLSRNVTVRLVAALVLSRLDYCNAVLAGLPASTLAPLQWVLHAVARIVFNLKPRDHTLSLRKLHWLPVAARIQCKLFAGAQDKTTLGHTPDNITDHIADLLTPVAVIPARSSLRLNMPRTCQRIGTEFSRLLLRRLETGCQQNSSNCDRQRHSDKNSRLICSARLTYGAEKRQLFNFVMHHRSNSRVACRSYSNNFEISALERFLVTYERSRLSETTCVDRPETISCYL